MEESSTRRKVRSAVAGKSKPKTRSKAKRAPADAAKPAAAAGATAQTRPLDFMLALMHDEAAPAALRLSAARAAAPYVHARHAGGEGEGGDVRGRELLTALVVLVQEQGGGASVMVKQC